VPRAVGEQVSSTARDQASPKGRTRLTEERRARIRVAMDRP